VSSFTAKSAGAVVVFKLTPSTSPAAASALLSELQKRQQNDRNSIARPLAVCLLADHDKLSQEWRNALGASPDQPNNSNNNGGFFYIVVPPATAETAFAGPSDAIGKRNANAPAPPSQLVWYCGLFRQARLREGAMRAVIDCAVAAKRAGSAFSKLAKDWNRLEELASTLQGCSGGASRLEHLFAKTPLHVRSQLQLDATAAYSVTDQTTADEITQQCLRLKGVKEALTRGGVGCACVDLTACIGGNLLSFVQGGFSKVVGVESDVARFDMLRHNVQVMVSPHLASRVNLICGDSTAIVGDFHNDSSGSNGSNGAGLNSTVAAPASLPSSSNAVWRPTAEPAVYFLDPPWGGLDYKDQDRVSLYLGEEDIASVCLKCLALPGCLHVVLKAPYNADTSGLIALTTSATARHHRSACGAQSFVVRPLQTWSLSKKVKCFVLSRETIQDQRGAGHQAPVTASAASKKKKDKRTPPHVTVVDENATTPVAGGVEPSTSSVAEELAQMAREAQGAPKASKKKRAKKIEILDRESKPLNSPKASEDQPSLKKMKVSDEDQRKDDGLAAAGAAGATALEETGDVTKKKKKKKNKKDRSERG